MLFNKQVRKGEWQVAVASTFRNHIVVCGLGRVGYRVVEQLLQFGEEVVGGIDRREESRFVERVWEWRLHRGLRFAGHAEPVATTQPVNLTVRGS